MADAKPSTYTRRTFLARIIRSGWTWLLAGLASISYPLYIERHWIKTTRLAIALRKLPSSFHGLTILQFTDTHLGHFFDATDLRMLIEKMQQLRPDVICFTGDLYDLEHSEVPETIEALSALSAPHGKFAVLGNHDYRGYPEQTRMILEKSGFTVLNNTRVELQRNTEKIHIAGVDCIIHGHPDLKQALSDVKQEECVILLVHEPDYADHASRYPVDLQLSGHSHGGQVRLPFFGAILTPPLGHKYPDGLQYVPGSSLRVYTSRGIGTTILPIRLLCRPEISLITLVTDSNK